MTSFGKKIVVGGMAVITIVIGAVFLRDTAGNPINESQIVAQTKTTIELTKTAPSPKGTRVVETTATTTKYTPAYTMLEFETEMAVQGFCLVLPDSDGNGKTYLTANNGILKASAIECTD